MIHHRGTEDTEEDFFSLIGRPQRNRLRPDGINRKINSIGQAFHRAGDDQRKKSGPSGKFFLSVLGVSIECMVI